MKRNVFGRLLALVWMVIAAACWASAAAQTLYVADAQYNQFFTLSTTDGKPSPIGSPGSFGVLGAMAGLAYDGEHDVLYGSTIAEFGTTGRENLYRMDRTTGVASLVGPIGVSGMQSLAYVDGVLYGASTSDGFREGTLYRINTDTGAAALVGSIGNWGFGGRVNGMAFNPNDHLLYGCLNFYGPDVGGIVTIDTITGRGTLLFTTRPFQGIAFDPGTGVLYGVHNGFGLQPASLYTIDLAGQSVNLVGLTGLGNTLDCAFVSVPEPCTLPIVAAALIIVAVRWSSKHQR